MPAFDETEFDRLVLQDEEFRRGKSGGPSNFNEDEFNALLAKTQPPVTSAPVGPSKFKVTAPSELIAAKLGLKSNSEDRIKAAQESYPNAKVYPSPQGTVTVAEPSGEIHNFEQPDFGHAIAGSIRGLFGLDREERAQPVVGDAIRTNAASSLPNIATRGAANAIPGGIPVSIVANAAVPVVNELINKMTAGGSSTSSEQLREDSMKDAAIAGVAGKVANYTSKAAGNIVRDVKSLAGNIPAQAEKALLALGLRRGAGPAVESAAMRDAARGFNMSDDALPPSGVLASVSPTAPVAIAEAQSSNPAAKAIEDLGQMRADKALNAQASTHVKPEVEAQLKNEMAQSETGAAENVRRAAQRRLNAKASAEDKVKTAKNDYLDNQEQLSREQSTEDYARSIQEAERKAAVSKLPKEDQAKVKPIEPAYPPEPREAFRAPNTPELVETARGNMVAKQGAERVKESKSYLDSILEGKKDTLGIRSAQAKSIQDSRISEALRSRIAQDSIPGEFDAQVVSALKAAGSSEASHLLKIDAFGKQLKEASTLVKNAAQKPEPLTVKNLFKGGAKAAATIAGGPISAAFWANKGLKALTSDKRALNSVLSDPQKLSAIYDLAESGLPEQEMSQALQKLLTLVAESD